MSRLITTPEKVVVKTGCNKFVRMNQQILKKDKFGLYITYTECPFYNIMCNCTCNVQIVEG